MKNNCIKRYNRKNAGKNSNKKIEYEKGRGLKQGKLSRFYTIRRDN